jgi:hypothetical protein
MSSPSYSFTPNVVFEGSTSINLSTKITSVPGNNPRTVEFKLKTTDSQGSIFSTGTPTAHKTFNIRLLAGCIGFMGYSHDFYPCYRNYASGITVNDGEWHHIFVTWDSTTLKIFVDGTISSATTTFYSSDTPLSSSALQTTGNSNFIGRNNHGSSSDYFTGEIKDINLYDSAIDVMNTRGSSCDGQCHIGYTHSVNNMISCEICKAGFYTEPNPSVVCADETEACLCDGTVYFGKKYISGTPGTGTLNSLETMLKNSPFITRDSVDSTMCDVDTLGDPASGFYKSCWCAPRSDPSCTVCPEGKYANIISSQSCIEVSPGSFSSIDGVKAVSGATGSTPCPTGTYSSAGQSSCALCPVGFYSDEGASTCTVCPTGQSTSTQGGSICDICSSGYYSNKILAKSLNENLHDVSSETAMIAGGWSIDCPHNANAGIYIVECSALTSYAG